MPPSVEFLGHAIPQFSNQDLRHPHSPLSNQDPGRTHFSNQTDAAGHQGPFAACDRKMKENSSRPIPIVLAQRIYFLSRWQRLDSLSTELHCERLNRDAAASTQRLCGGARLQLSLSTEATQTIISRHKGDDKRMSETVNSGIKQ